MAFDYRYINRHDEEGKVWFTLLIENSETKLEYRIEKSFKIDSKLIDKEFLRTEAKKEIDRIENEVILEQVEEIQPETEE
jgi:hypothetical protein